MALIARSAERLVGYFAYFVEEGASVDGQTVSKTVIPDATPTDNWPSFGDVLPGAQFETETADDNWLQLQPGGGYINRMRQRVTGDFFNFQTREMNELVDRLLFGLSSEITEDTALSPFTVYDRKITGWLLLQARQLGGNGDGTDDHRQVMWCELRLSAPPAAENSAQSPELRAQRLPADANSLYFPAAA